MIRHHSLFDLGRRSFHHSFMRAICAMTVLMLPLTWLACSHDAYESGDGKYSYLRADFVAARSGTAGQIVSATTDEGETLSFSEPVAAKWATTADSTYRALLYYNLRDAVAEPLSISRVPVLQPVLASAVEAPRQDPVGLQSGWVSTNGGYLNLGLLLKAGKSDDEEAAQSVGVVCDSIVGGNAFLRLLHDQGQVPEYYTVRQYVSIPLTELLAGKTVHLSVNTYDGLLTRTFAAPNF